MNNQNKYFGKFKKYITLTVPMAKPLSLLRSANDDNASSLLQSAEKDDIDVDATSTHNLFWPRIPVQRKDLRLNHLTRGD